VLFDTVHFAAGTPYETLLARPLMRGERLLAPEVATTAREALIEVVTSGTARRLQGVYQGPDRRPLQVGGKTGTGDHRRDSYGASGRLVGTRVVSRAATFVFFLGERFFGVVTAYVTGPEAARYHFTSALPVQVLKGLAPTLTPLLKGGQEYDNVTPVVTMARHGPGDSSPCEKSRLSATARITGCAGRSVVSSSSNRQAAKTASPPSASQASHRLSSGRP